MAHLIISFVAALAMAATVYTQTSSFSMAILAYVGAGMMVFLAGLIASAMAVSNEENFSAARG